MGRVAKKPQYEAFNRGFNCFGRHQEHTQSLGDWRRPDLPLMLEIGAGAAAVSLAFSSQNPNWQVLALDRKSDRLHKAARRNKNASLAFLQADFDDFDTYVDLRGQVNLLWLAFPDPQPGKRREKHRLTHPARLVLYRSLLGKGAAVRLKTDDPVMFSYSLEVFQAQADFTIESVIEDLVAAGYENQPDDVRVLTQYERRFLERGLPIRYLEARFRP